MGRKLLSSSLQTIPWCLHVMGKQMKCMQQFPHADPDVDEYPPTVHCSTVKLIQDDGHVQVFYRPVPASELMVEFPKHLICHSDSLFIGQKIPALSGSDLLQLGHKYFLLPKHLFQSVLSFVTIASFMTTSSSSPSSSSSSTDADKARAKAAFVKKAASCRPFHIQKSPSGTLQIRVSDDFILKLTDEGGMTLRSGEHREVNLVNASKNSHPLRDNNKNKEDSKQQVLIPNGNVATSVLCTTPDLEKDYTRLVAWKRSKDWKPKLETIKEKKEKNTSQKTKKKTTTTTNKGSTFTSTIGHHDHNHSQLTKPSHGHKKNSKHEQKKQQQLLHPNMSLITTSLVKGSSSSTTSITKAKAKRL